MKSLCHASELEELLARAEVGVFVSLRLGGEGATGGPEVDQGLHGLQLMGLQHVQCCGCQHEVAEAAV